MLSCGSHQPMLCIIRYRAWCEEREYNHMGAHFPGALVKSDLGRQGRGELPLGLTWDSKGSWWYPTSSQSDASYLAEYFPESGFEVYPRSNKRNCCYVYTFVCSVRAKGTLLFR